MGSSWEAMATLDKTGTKLAKAQLYYRKYDHAMLHTIKKAVKNPSPNTYNLLFCYLMIRCFANRAHHRASDGLLKRAWKVCCGVGACADCDHSMMMAVSMLMTKHNMSLWSTSSVLAAPVYGTGEAVGGVMVPLVGAGM